MMVVAVCFGDSGCRVPAGDAALEPVSAAETRRVVDSCGLAHVPEWILILFAMISVTRGITVSGFLPIGKL